MAAGLSVCLPRKGGVGAHTVIWQEDRTPDRVSGCRMVSFQMGSSEGGAIKIVHIENNITKLQNNIYFVGSIFKQCILTLTKLSGVQNQFLRSYVFSFLKVCMHPEETVAQWCTRRRFASYEWFSPDWKWIGVRSA